MNQSDFLVIGSGVAGLFFAVRMAEAGTVAVVTKRGRSDTNTSWAQGGIAAVTGEADSFEQHAADTLKCGAGLCREDVVESVVRSAPSRIDELASLGVDFSREDGRLALGREGGHSAKRIVHSHDRTGRAIQEALVQRALEHPNIHFYPNHMAVGLIQDRHLEDSHTDNGTVHGAYIFDAEANRVEPFVAKRTILATGGAGKVYRYTSNPDVATGDGIAMAYRAGARVANLEFVQFHPTCLYHPEAKSFLLSETLRGEGGELKRTDGFPFMKDYHPDGELASRDVVARAIDQELKTSGAKFVYLDMTHLDADRVRNRFPHIYERCNEFGIDITTDPIPVVPATHYFCGGVNVDGFGRASLDHLFALGEVSHTGLHGANRLASNSLLEAVAFAESASTMLLKDDALKSEAYPSALPWEAVRTERLMESVIIEHDWETARRIMWDYVGIVRSDHRLKIGLERMQQLSNTVESLYWKCDITQDLLELRNVVLVGELVIRCALQRKESRGLHHTETYPERDDKRFLHDTILEIGEE
jgi:L-aspartate oxidase